MRLKALAVLALVAGCGLFQREHAQEKTTSVVDKLNDRAGKYCALEDAGADQYGFVGKDCDLVLFNALRSIGCPTSTVDLDVAESLPAQPGEWNRDPAHACYNPKSPGSSRFSRDMLTGLFLWAWRQGPPALPVIERLVAYVEAHDGYICDASDAITRITHCKLGGGMQATLYELRFRLGGADSDKRNGAAVFDPTAIGFERHVQGLHLYLRGLMYGALTDPELATLEQYGKANALLAAMARKFVSGDLDTITAGVLSDGVRFPSDHLPDSLGRCNDYLWQRDAGDDWQPCPSSRAFEQYTGVDLAFFRGVVTDALPVGRAAQTDLTEPRPHRYHRLGQ